MMATFLIGNGYDRAIGLHTGYNEFLDEYSKQKTNNANPEVRELIDRMKEDIKANRTLWADLEMTLGKYTERFDDWEEFASVYEDLNKGLRQYIEKEQARLVNDIKFSQKAALDGFLKPTSLLEPADRVSMQSFFKTYGSITETNIITLNYTNTIEQEIDAAKPQFTAINTNHVYHLHGTVDGTIILGVSNATQIANTSFRGKEYLKDLLIKSETNKTMKSQIDVTSKSLISSSNLIVTFGVSMGESDDYIWREIGKQLPRSNYRLIIYKYAPDLDFTHTKWKLGKAENDVRDDFLKKDRVKGDVTQQMRDNIIVAFNKPLFGDGGNV